MKRDIRKGKLEYKRKIEKHFQTNNMKKVCEGLNVTSDNKDKENQLKSNSADYSNDLNRLYARFDCHYFGFEREGIRDRLANGPTQEQGEITVADEEILKVLRKNQ